MNFKKLFVLPIMASLLFSACSSKNEVNPFETDNSVAGDVLINHPQKAFGGMPPEWVQKVAGGGSNSEIAALYPNQVVFTATNRGENLDALKIWLNNVNVNQIVSSQLHTSVLSKTAAIETANSGEVERLSETLTAITSKAKFTGLKKEAEYWLQFRTEEGNTYYDYYVLYMMDKSTWNANLDRINKGLNGEAKEIFTPAFDRVKSEGLFDEM